jgi:hypothetical protein
MRTVRHPLVMFVMAVLVVIGIGVGVVAATTSQKVYGPSWGRFTAAFTGRVYESQEPPKVRVSSGLTDTFASLSYANQPWSGWVAYAPLGIVGPSDLHVVTVTEGMSGILQSKTGLLRLVAADKTFLGPGTTEDEASANGLTIITLGPECADGQCHAEMVVSNGQVSWDLLAFSNGSVSTVQGFLNSFEPIG